LQPVPVGVLGELYAGGDGVACGYLNQPQLTAERFISDPFNSRAGARLYRTGDQVRWRPDGNLEFLRRLDSQAKIRGFRVELGEIETVLHETAGVREAVVSLREDTAGEKRLVAYVVAGGNSVPDEPGLKAALKARLPDYMIPSQVEFQSATVESLTRRLTGENWAPPWSSLVPLQPLGSLPPLFFVHGVGGDVYGFLELAKLLPSDQPSYGIQAVGLDGKSARHVTVED